MSLNQQIGETDVDRGVNAPKSVGYELEVAPGYAEEKQVHHLDYSFLAPLSTRLVSAPLRVHYPNKKLGSDHYVWDVDRYTITVQFSVGKDELGNEVRLDDVLSRLRGETILLSFNGIGHTLASDDNNRNLQYENADVCLVETSDLLLQRTSVGGVLTVTYKPPRHANSDFFYGHKLGREYLTFDATVTEDTNPILDWLGYREDNLYLSSDWGRLWPPAERAQSTAAADFKSIEYRNGPYGNGTYIVNSSPFSAKATGAIDNTSGGFASIGSTSDLEVDLLFNSRFEGLSATTPGVYSNLDTVTFALSDGTSFTISAARFEMTMPTAIYIVGFRIYCRHYQPRTHFLLGWDSEKNVYDVLFSERAANRVDTAQYRGFTIPRTSKKYAKVVYLVREITPSSRFGSYHSWYGRLVLSDFRLRGTDNEVSKAGVSVHQLRRDLALKVRPNPLKKRYFQ
jgi:hypothetical protein